MSLSSCCAGSQSRFAQNHFKEALSEYRAAYSPLYEIPPKSTLVYSVPELDCAQKTQCVLLEPGLLSDESLGDAQALKNAFKLKVLTLLSGTSFVLA